MLKNTLAAGTLGILPILAASILSLATLGLLYPEELKGGGGGGSGSKPGWGSRPVDYPVYFQQDEDDFEDVVLMAYQLMPAFVLLAEPTSRN